MFNLFNGKVIPHDNIEVQGDGTRKQVTKVLSQHGEIEREEYNYEWNSDGIRWREFHEKPEIITMGCSISLGTGMPLHLIWPSLLESKVSQYGYSVGNLSYNGASPSKNISSLFGLINQYKYLPKIIIANFADFERSYFVSRTLDSMQDVFWYPHMFKTKSYAPHDWPNLLPVEWIHFNNLEHIKMLELFCEYAGIKLIWTTWYDYEDKKEEVNTYLKNNFKNYVVDQTISEFSTKFQYTVPEHDAQNINKYYECFNDNCHLDYKETYGSLFYYAYDYHRNSVPYVEGLPPLQPHVGLHRHLHWSEFFFNQIRSYLI